MRWRAGDGSGDVDDEGCDDCGTCRLLRKGEVERELLPLREAPPIAEEWPPTEGECSIDEERMLRGDTDGEKNALRGDIPVMRALAPADSSFACSSRDVCALLRPMLEVSVCVSCAIGLNMPPAEVG